MGASEDRDRLLGMADASYEFNLRREALDRLLTATPRSLTTQAITRDADGWYTAAETPNAWAFAVRYSPETGWQMRNGNMHRSAERWEIDFMLGACDAILTAAAAAGLRNGSSDNGT